MRVIIAAKNGPAAPRVERGRRAVVEGNYFPPTMSSET
jgi:hypothetical protein